MTLPDWTTAINTQVSTFLAWGTVSTVVTIVIGVAIGSMVLSLLLKAVLRS